jgi:hypothetical protein
MSHCRRNGESVRSFQPIEPLPHRSQGQKCGQCLPRQSVEHHHCRVELIARPVAQVSDSRIQRRRANASQYILWGEPVAFEKLERQKKLAARGMVRQRGQEAGYRRGNTRWPRSR